MTIEMPATAPFLYPSPPEDFSAWDQETKEKAEKMQEREQIVQSPEGKRMPPEDGRSLREQAEALLKGKRAWRPGWMDWDSGGGGKGVGAGLGM